MTLESSLGHASFTSLEPLTCLSMSFVSGFSPAIPDRPSFLLDVPFLESSQGSVLTLSHPAALPWLSLLKASTPKVEMIMKWHFLP